MHLPLKEYQERTLETLTAYYQNCLRLQNANTAFYDITERPYAAVEGLPGMPYVCLRLPTGGGKTFVACHAVGITASELLKTESPIVLWLTPSNAIRDQTLKALRNPNHPYRDAFESARHRVEEGMTQPDSEPAPAARGEVFKVPKLMVERNQTYLDFEASRFLETVWQLSECNAELTEEEFPSEFNTGERGEIGLSQEGRVEMRFLGQLHQQMSFLAPDGNWDATQLANWLDRTIKHLDILQRESLPFLQRLVKYLVEERSIPIEVLIRNKYALKDAAAAKIDSHRQNVHQTAYENYLLPECATPVVVSPDHCFSFEPHSYPYNTHYTGHYQFQKHYYEHIGDLKSDGEEFQCAQFIDTLPEVKFWVRNLERKPLHSFWLQTSTDKFYPDFVCLLKDGRYLVVEYKGLQLWSADDAKEKREIGELWEARSGGQCLFIMPKGPDLDAIRAKLS